MRHDDRYTAAWTGALSGNSDALRALGIPSITQYPFPLAFVRNRWWVDEETKVVRAVLVPELRPFDPGFDVVDYFLTLHRKSNLPFVTEIDVLRFLMALAAPLLRQLAPGLVGAFWFLGASGSGKDFFQGLLGDIHTKALQHPPAHAIAEMQVKDELQMERSFHDNRSVIYVRSNEIGKRVKLIDSFIRFAAAPSIAIKGLQKAEAHIPNTFTYLADSVENLPARREIERRTVTIDVKKADNTTSLGALTQTVCAKAPDIIGALIRLLETRERDWYLRQPDLQGRPLFQKCLARIFDVTLDEIVGRDMSDVFEAMRTYTMKEVAQIEGLAEKEKCRASDGLGAGVLPSYRYSHFREVLTNGFDEAGRHCDPQGFRNLFEEFPTPDRLRATLDREVEYTKVGRGKQPYLPVTVRNERYAFRFVRSGRNFIFEKEKTFCEKTGTTEIPHENSEPASAVETAPVENAATASPMTPDYCDFPSDADA